MKWILVIYVISSWENLRVDDAEVALDVERVAAFETQAQCEEAAEKVKNAFVPSESRTKVRWACIQGE